MFDKTYKTRFFSKPNSTCSRAAYRLIVLFMPSVLWRCWLGGRMGIRSAKTEWWGAGVVICLERGANLHIRPSWCYCHSLSLASVKSRLVLPFWYRLTRVVLEKGPLNGCVCVCVIYDCRRVLGRAIRNTWLRSASVVTSTTHSTARRSATRTMSGRPAPLTTSLKVASLLTCLFWHRTHTLHQPTTILGRHHTYSDISVRS